MPTASEKEAFSNRLQLAMRRVTPPINGATELAEALSMQHPEAVSPQTAHKWLTGRATPRPAMAAVIAKTLYVEEHWLRYGPAPLPEIHASKRDASPPTSDAEDLARKIHALSPHRRYLVEELVNQLFAADSGHR